MTLSPLSAIYDVTSSNVLGDWFCVNRKGGAEGGGLQQHNQAVKISQ